LTQAAGADLNIFVFPELSLFLQLIYKKKALKNQAKR